MGCTFVAPSRRPSLDLFLSIPVDSRSHFPKRICPSPGSNGKPVLGLDAVKSHTLQTPTHLDFLTGIKEVWTSPSSLSKLFARSSKFVGDVGKTTYRAAFVMILQSLSSPIPVARTGTDMIALARRGWGHQSTETMVKYPHI